MSDDKPVPAGNGFLATIQAGIASLLGNASHQPLKKIVIGKPIMFNYKNFLGTTLFLKDETSVEVEFHDEAQKLTAEAEKEAAMIEANGTAEADKIEAQGRADADRIEAENSHSGRRPVRHEKKK